jgi:hypothetical protein
MDPQKKSTRIFPIKNRVLSLLKNIGLDYIGRSYGWSKSIDYFLVILMWKTPIHLGSVKIISGLPIYPKNPKLKRHQRELNQTSNGQFRQAKTGIRVCKGFEGKYEGLGGSLALQKFHLSHLDVDLQSDTTVGLQWASLKSIQFFFWQRAVAPGRKVAPHFCKEPVGSLGAIKG